MTNTLTHHGTKGMRWGVRRYQNEDGSLTAAGKKRYGVDETKADKRSDSDVNKYKTKVADGKKIAKIVLSSLGAAAVTGAAIYGAVKIGKEFEDFANVVVGGTREMADALFDSPLWPQ